MAEVDQDAGREWHGEIRKHTSRRRPSCQKQPTQKANRSTCNAILQHNHRKMVGTRERPDLIKTLPVYGICKLARREMASEWPTKFDVVGIIETAIHYAREHILLTGICIIFLHYVFSWFVIRMRMVLKPLTSQS